MYKWNWSNLCQYTFVFPLFITALRFDDGTANEDDYHPLPDEYVVVFPPWVSDVEVDIPIQDDPFVEGIEFFYVYVQAITGEVVPGSVSATVEILDDDCKMNYMYMY